jgi:hypothetical protein
MASMSEAVEGVRFVHRLRREDRRLLRDIVKRVHFSQFPVDYITDEEADRVIAAQAPKVIEAMLEFAVDRGLRDEQ